MLRLNITRETERFQWQMLQSIQSSVCCGTEW